MLRGLWKLTWIEIKVFMREPMGAFAPSWFQYCSSWSWAGSPTTGSRRPRWR